MHEKPESKISSPEESIATEHIEKESGLEKEELEAGLILEKAKIEVEEFISSGLPIAEKIAAEMGIKVDLETEKALTGLNQQAELARQMLADSLVGKLRLKSADFLKKYLPNLELTALVEGKNAEIISKRIAAELQGLLKYNYNTGDYDQAFEAARYFEEHKDLLIGSDKDQSVARVLEAVEIHEQKQAELLSTKTVEELQELLKYNYDYQDYEQAFEAARYFEEHKDLLVGRDKDQSEANVLDAIRVHKKAIKFREEREAELLSKKTVEELQKLLKDSNEDFEKIIQAVDYFLQHEDLIIGREKNNQGALVFEAINSHLYQVATCKDKGAWQKALSEYNRIPNNFLVDRDIKNIAWLIYVGALNQSLGTQEILAAFEGNPDLLAAGSRYHKEYDNFSSKERVKIVEETYKKLGASEHIAQYDIGDFESEDREKILKPLFESYKIYDQRKLLKEMGAMKEMYKLLPLEERNGLINNFIDNNSNEVFNQLEQGNLALDEEQKKYLVKYFIDNRNYQYLLSEKNLEKLGASKDEIFNELLMNNAANLFVQRNDFNTSPEQYKLLLERITSNFNQLERVLNKINHSDNKEKLTTEELQIFETIVTRDAPHLMFKYKNIFEKACQEMRDSFFKELPQNISDHELANFLVYVAENLGGWAKNVERVRTLITEAGEKKVTNEYLEQLGNIGLKLPNRVMGKIKENINKVEQINLFNYIKKALEQNTTLDKVKREAQKKLEQVTTKADYFKAIHPDVLRSVLKDRRFKTQFETYSSGGTLNPEYRAEEEAKMFNYNNNKEKGKTVRPNYGYMSDNENGVVGTLSENSISSNVAHYGRIHVKFKKEQVSNRTTVTFNDSLGNVDGMPPTPSIKPHFVSLYEYSDPNKVEQASNPRNWGSSYLEVQYHWPLRTSSIESIHISEKNYLSREEMREVEEMVKDYNEQNSNDQIKLVIY